MLEFQQQASGKAGIQLEKALELGLKEAPLYNFLGICYSRTNRLSNAVMSYRQALRLDPKLAEAHLNLAYAYQRMNQRTPAQKEYESACSLEPKFCQYVPQKQ
jgi:superkiller protein 3